MYSIRIYRCFLGTYVPHLRPDVCMDVCSYGWGYRTPDFCLSSRVVGPSTNLWTCHLRTNWTHNLQCVCFSRSCLSVFIMRGQTRGKENKNTYIREVQNRFQSFIWRTEFLFWSKKIVMSNGCWGDETVSQKSFFGTGLFKLPLSFCEECKGGTGGRVDARL